MNIQKKKISTRDRGKIQNLQNGGNSLRELKKKKKN